jgi:hypothetical protein
MKLFGVVFAGFGLLFMCIGAVMAWRQDNRIAHSVPVPAQVIASRVEEHVSTDSDGRTSRSYKPVVEFTYSVDDRPYTSDETTPIGVSAGRTWAQGVVDAHPPGAEVTAWVDPRRPDRAFLLAVHSFLPYVFIMFPSVFVGVGLGIFLAGGASRSSPPAPVAGADGWHLLAPQTSLAAKRRSALLVTVAWFIVVGGAAGHYFVVASPPYETLAYVFTAIFGALGLIPLSLLIYYARLALTAADARVYIDKPQLVRGEDVTIGVQQALLDTRTVSAVRLGIVCEVTTRTRSGSKTTISTSPCFEDMETVLEGERIRGGERIEVSRRVTIPADQAASSAPRERSYPRTRWSIHLKVEIEDSPDYDAVFPVSVQ